MTDGHGASRVTDVLRVVLAVPSTEARRLFEHALSGEVELRQEHPSRAVEAAARWSGAVIVVRLADAAALGGRLLPSDPVLPPSILFLTGGQSIEEEWSAMVRHRVCHAIHHELIGDAAVLRWVFGRVRGLRPDVGQVAGFSTWRVTRMSETRQRHTVVAGLLEELERHGWPAEDAFQRRLVVEEVLANAYSHGLEALRATSRGHALGGEEGQVTVEHAVSAEALAFRVEDSAGALSPDLVRASIRHQVSGEGLLDESGRGLYIAYRLAQVFAVERKPGRSTRVELIIFRNRPSEHKAFVLTEW